MALNDPLLSPSSGRAALSLTPMEIAEASHTQKIEDRQFDLAKSFSPVSLIGEEASPPAIRPRELKGAKTAIDRHFTQQYADDLLKKQKDNPEAYSLFKDWGEKQGFSYHQVKRNFEKLKSQKFADENLEDIRKMVVGSRKVAEWATRPENAQFVKRPEGLKKATLLEKLYRAGELGISEIVARLDRRELQRHTEKIGLGVGTVGDEALAKRLAKSIAEKNQRVEKLRQELFRGKEDTLAKFNEQGRRLEQSWDSVFNVDAPSFIGAIGETFGDLKGTVADAYDYLKLYAKNPAHAATFIAQTLPSSSPSLIGGMIGSFGGPVGSLVGAAISGYLSYAFVAKEAEFYEAMAKQGVNWSDAESIYAGMTDIARLDKADSDSDKASIATAVTEAIGGKVLSKAFKFSRGLPGPLGVGVGAITGAATEGLEEVAGEIGASLAVGERPSAQEIVDSFVGGVGAGGVVGGGTSALKGIGPVSRKIMNLGQIKKPTAKKAPSKETPDSPKKEAPKEETPPDLPKGPPTPLDEIAKKDAPKEETPLEPTEAVSEPVVGAGEEPEVAPVELPIEEEPDAEIGENQGTKGPHSPEEDAPPPLPEEIKQVVEDVQGHAENVDTIKWALDIINLSKSLFASSESGAGPARGKTVGVTLSASIRDFAKEISGGGLDKLTFFVKREDGSYPRIDPLVLLHENLGEVSLSKGGPTFKESTEELLKTSERINEILEKAKVEIKKERTSDEQGFVKLMKLKDPEMENFLGTLLQNHSTWMEGLTGIYGGVSRAALLSSVEGRSKTKTLPARKKSFEKILGKDLEKFRNLVGKDVAEKAIAAFPEVVNVEEAVLSIESKISDYKKLKTEKEKMGWVVHQISPFGEMGAFDPRGVITRAKGSPHSTVFHELAHLMLSNMVFAYAHLNTSTNITPKQAEFRELVEALFRELSGEDLNIELDSLKIAGGKLSRMKFQTLEGIPVGSPEGNVTKGGGEALVKKGELTPFAQRSVERDIGYYGKLTEIFARLFEEYVSGANIDNIPPHVRETFAGAIKNLAPPLKFGESRLLDSWLTDEGDIKKSTAKIFDKIVDSGAIAKQISNDQMAIEVSKDKKGDQAGVIIKKERKVSQAVVRSFLKRLAENAKKRGTAEYRKSFEDNKEKAIEELREQFPALDAIFELKAEGFLLSKGDIREVLGKTRLSFSDELVGRKGNISLAEASAMAGFDSPRDMAEAMVKIPTDFTERVNDLAQLETDKEFDIENWTMREMIMAESLGSEYEQAREGQLKTELDYLWKKYKNIYRETLSRSVAKLPAWIEIKSLASKQVAEMDIKDFKPTAIAEKERKAARLAAAALKKGDVDTALKWKVEEAKLHEQWKLAYKFEKFRQKSIQKIKRYGNKKATEGRDKSLVSALQGFLTAAGFIRTPSRSVLKHLNGMKKYNPEGYEQIAAMTMKSLDSLGDGLLTVNKFVTVMNTADAVWSLAKEANEIARQEKAAMKDDLVQEAVAGLQNIKKAKVKPEGFFGAMIYSFDSALTMVSQVASSLDAKGKTGGFFKRTLIEPIQQAEVDYTTEFGKVAEKLKKLFNEHLDPQGDDVIFKPIAATEIEHTFKNKSELIGALLHTGNKGNMERLLVGYGWAEYNEYDVLDTSRWDAFLKRSMSDGTLTKSDMDLVQSVWDINKEILPKAQAAYFKIFGTYYEEIEHHSIDTPWGKYDGGYYPAVASEEERAMREYKADERAVLSGEYMAQQIFPWSSMGFTKGRAKRAERKLGLDPSYALAHVGMVLKFAHIQPAVIDTAKLLTDSRFRTELEAKHEGVYQEVLAPWMKDVVAQRRISPMAFGNEKLQEGLVKLRTLSAARIMFGNLKNAALQLTGISLAVPAVGAGRIVAHLRQGANPSLRAEINKKSEFMKNRSGNITFDTKKNIEKLLKKKTVIGKGWNFVLDNAYFLQNATQSFVDKVVWQAAYDKGLSTGKDENRAIKFADETVRSTQGSYEVSELTKAEKGTALARLFTMFARFNVMRYNLLKSEYNRITEGQDFDVTKHTLPMLNTATFVLLLPEIINAGLAVYLFKGAGDDDEDNLKDFAVNALTGSTFGAIPIVGQILQGRVQKALGEWAPPPRLSPVTSMADDFDKMMSAYKSSLSEDGDSWDALVGTVRAAGLILPIKPIEKAISGASAIQDGGIDDDEILRALIIGR